MYLGNSTDVQIVPNDTIHYTRPATVFAAVAASIFSVVGVIGNLITVVALLRCQKLRVHATTAFVISLAVSDLLFSAINLPLTASRYVHEEWILGESLCRLFPFFFYGNVAASLMNMVAITINRYVLISCHAQYSRIYSRTNIWLMIAAVWLFSFGMMLPPLVEVWGKLGLDKQTFSCTILKVDGKSPKKFFMVFGFVFPCLAIIFCYLAIFYRVRQSRKNVQKHVHSPKEGQKETPLQASQRRDDIRLTKMMLTIFISFLICFLPLMLVNTVDDDVTVPVLHVIASVLAWASAIINPFIYAFKNRQYQQAFRKILCTEKRTSATAGRGGTSQASGQSRTSASRTFITEMLHYNAGNDKVKMVSGQQNGVYKPTTQPISVDGQSSWMPPRTQKTNFLVCNPPRSHRTLSSTSQVTLLRYSPNSQTNLRTIIPDKDIGRIDLNASSASNETNEIEVSVKSFKIETTDVIKEELVKDPAKSPRAPRQ